MLFELILKKFIDKNTKEYDRAKIGYFSGIIGIISNVFLTVLKIIFGLYTNSVAIMADAINNLTDVMSSVITILGFKISNTPPDKDHPYGHKRAEHITTFVISIIILFVGIQFVKTSFERIVNPQDIKISNIVIMFLIISIVLKFLISILNKKLGELINSKLLIATSLDSLTDCFTTLIVLFSGSLSKYFNFSIDGFIGLLISIYIIYSGFSIAKETVSYLIGKAPDDELFLNVINEIKKYDLVLGIHNLKFHNYGSENIFATADVEFDAKNSFVKVHNVVSVIEKEIFEKYKITLAIHSEPIGGKFTQEEIMLKNILDNYIKDFSYVKSIHDFAIYKTNNQNFVALEIVVDVKKLNSNFDEKTFIENIKKLIIEYDNNLNISIRILNEYI